MTRPDTHSSHDRHDGSGQDGYDPRRATVRRRRALRLATELCDLTPDRWQARSVGADTATACADDDPVLADVLTEARALARSRPVAALVRSQAGVGGLVVAAHGPTWSLVARSGGPVLVVTDDHPTGVRVDLVDAAHRVDLDATVAELIAASRTQPGT